MAFLWENDLLCLKWVERGLNYSSIALESPEKYQFVQHEEMVAFGKVSEQNLTTSSRKEINRRLKMVIYHEYQVFECCNKYA